MTTFDPYAPSRDTTEGKVFSVTGGDWDALVQEIGATKEERVVVNMGPQHPSTRFRARRRNNHRSTLRYWLPAHRN